MTRTSNNQRTEEPVVMGRVSGLYGVKGWVKVFSFTEPREAILDYRHCLIGHSGSWQQAEIAEGKKHGKTVIVRIDDTADRDAAAELVGREIAVDRSDLPAPADGEYYWADLEGLGVEHKDPPGAGMKAK